MKQLEIHSYIITKAIVFKKAYMLLVKLKTIRKVCTNVKYVMDVLRKDDAHKQIPVIRLEIDYELVTLHDALQANDQVEIIKSKERLEMLRQKWMELKTSN